MKITLLALILSLGSISQAACTLYRDANATTVFGAIDRGLLLANSPAQEVIGHFDATGTTLYQAATSNIEIGRREGDSLYETRYGAYIIGVFQGCTDADFRP